MRGSSPRIRSDGNGRFARAALQGALAREGVIATPCLALAPVFYLHGAALRDAIGALCRTGAWEPWFEAMGAVLAEAMRRVAGSPL